MISFKQYSWCIKRRLFYDGSKVRKWTWNICISVVPRNVTIAIERGSGKQLHQRFKHHQKGCT